MCAARGLDLTPDATEPLRAWQDAADALRAAEMRGASHSEIVLLSAEVIRRRNVVTVARLQDGWQPPDDILSHLMADDRLLLEKDDATGPPVRSARIPRTH